MNYYFKTDTTASTFWGSFTSDDAQNLNPTEGRLLIAVTQAQYGSGDVADWNALAQGVKDAGIVAAKEAAADYDNWDEKAKALTRLFVIEINKLRVKNGDAPYTKAQVVNALKDEM